jgi:hypothetical protein
VSNVSDLRLSPRLSRESGHGDASSDLDACVGVPELVQVVRDRRRDTRAGDHVRDCSHVSSRGSAPAGLLVAAKQPIPCRAIIHVALSVTGP